MTEPVITQTSGMAVVVISGRISTIPRHRRSHGDDNEHTLTGRTLHLMTPLPPAPVFVTAIDHVGIAVPDFAAAVEFYRATFGLELAHEEINEEQGVHEGMLRAPGDSSTGAAVQL